MRQVSITISVLLVSLAVAASAQDEPQVRVQALATNYPLAYFADRIGGSQVQVRVALPGEGDPAERRPSLEDIGRLNEAALLVLNGAGYEPWTHWAALRRRRTVVTTRGLEGEFISLDAATHQHGPEGDHSHGPTAFTTWLDVEMASAQAARVADALSRALPDGCDECAENLLALNGELEEIDEALREAVGENASRPVVFSHPVYQYLERRYELNGRSVHFEPEEDPGEAGWRSLEALLEEHPATVMIWEGEPSAASVARLEAMGIASVVFDPMSEAPADGDFLDGMRRNIEALRVAYAENGEPGRGAEP